jgi:hypothetical protein
MSFNNTPAACAGLTTHRCTSNFLAQGNGEKAERHEHALN